jgi:hypothetical protein
MARGKESNELAFTSQCFTLQFDVYPPITMVRENALKLATSLGSHQELTDIHMSDESWTFRRPQAKGHSRGQVEVSVEEQEVKIEQRTPAGALERFETLVEQTVSSVEAVFSPEAIWGSVISLEYLADFGSDAREAILGNLDMLEDENEGNGKLGVFGRPCHFVGLRLGFPAFEYKEEEGDEEKKEEAKEKGKAKSRGIDWHATLTILSVPDNPKAVSVEVTGRWIGAVSWSEVSSLLNKRLTIVDDFLKTKTRDFLQKFRSEE